MRLKKKLQKENPEELKKFSVYASDRNYNFWQRDPLAISIFSREMALQKLNYMHYNPIQEHWKLCNAPEEYRYSSASFYEMQQDEFKIVTHYLEDI